MKQIILRSQLRFSDTLAAFNRISLKHHLIKSVEEWVDDSQRAFPKVDSFRSGMKPVNRTLLLPLLSRCQQLLEDNGTNGQQINSTTSSPLSSTTPEPTTSTSRETYDNAYFYILFVMFFYSFLAMALFKCFIGSDEDKKDPYEEFISPGQPSTGKFNAGHMVEKFYFEEESSL